MTALAIAAIVVGLIYVAARKLGWKWVLLALAGLAAAVVALVVWTNRRDEEWGRRQSIMAYVTPYVYATHFSSIDDKGILRFDVLVLREPRYAMSMDDIIAGKPELRPVPYGAPGLIAEVPVRVHCATDTYYFDEGRYFDWASFSKTPTPGKMPALIAAYRLAGRPDVELEPLVRMIPDSLDATKAKIIYAACRNAGPDADAHVEELIRRARSGTKDSSP